MNLCVLGSLIDAIESRRREKELIKRISKISAMLVIYRLKLGFKLKMFTTQQPYSAFVAQWHELTAVVKTL